MEEQLEKQEMAEPSEAQQLKELADTFREMGLDAAARGNEQMAEYYSTKAAELEATSKKAMEAEKPTLIERIKAHYKAEQEEIERTKQTTAYKMGLPLTEKGWKRKAEEERLAKGETPLYKMYMNEANRCRAEEAAKKQK